VKKVLILAVAVSLIIAGVAVASVVSSKHDMRLEDTANQSGAKAVCEFCHHPHRGTSTDGITNALIWNKIYNTTTTYTAYATTATMNGTPADVSMSANLNADGLYATALCMSCHDGANATNGLVKAPMGGSTSLTITYDVTSANLGDTLADDHPVNFAYTDITTDDIPSVTTGVGPTDYAIVGNISSAEYPLFGTNKYFQCSTCHDVHRGDNSASSAVQFMRGNTENSEICRDCHTAK